jgi:hypothetical protein
MRTRLTIGLIERDHGWTSVLRQIGVTFEGLDWNRVDVSEYPVIIVNRSMTRAEAGRIGDYLAAGGAVLDVGELARHLELATRSSFVSSVADATAPFERTWLVDVEHRIESLVDAGALGRTVTLGEHGGGWIAHVPFDIASITRAARATRRRFHSPTGHHPDEVVARVPRHPYRVIVESALEWLHARRGLPFVHLWHYPDDARGLFAYRIDTDYGTPAHMLRLRSLADAYGVPMTLFLHVGAHEDHLDLFRDFGNHELAAHGYRHRTFSSYEANWGNMAEARQVMTAAGYAPTGFAAPTGRWNRGLDRALREHGFEYSSEFTLDYDGLPFFPSMPDGFSPVLQVPIHPVSVGNLTRAHAPEKAIDAYFQAVIDRQLAHRAPVILYHHPLQESWQIVESIFERARAERLAMTTMSDYATWWRARDRARLQASVDAGRLELSLMAPAERLRVRVVDPVGRECLVEPGGPLALASAEWSARPSSTYDLPSNLPAIRRTTFTMLRHSLEDAISRFRQ